jgi:hypothetical protein
LGASHLQGMRASARSGTLHTMATPALIGIHHVTAIASSPQRNLNRHTQVLGPRLVTLTIHLAGDRGVFEPTLPALTLPAQRAGA